MSWLFFKNAKKTAEVLAVERFNGELDELLLKNDYIFDERYRLLTERYSKVYDTLVTIKSSNLLIEYCKKNKIKRDFIDNFLNVFKILKSVISSQNEKLTEIISVKEGDSNTAFIDGPKEYDVVDYYDIEQRNTMNKIGVEAKSDENKPYGCVVAETIIDACYEISKTKEFGVNVIVNVLRGSKAKKILRRKLNELDCYGVLKKIKKGTLNSIVNYLIDRNFLYKSGGQYPVLWVSKDRIVEDINDIEIDEIEKIIFTDGKDNDKAIVNVDGFDLFVDENGEIKADTDLLARLKLLRADISREKNPPPYCVATNKVLILLSTAQPTTKKDFLKIKGIGEKWFQNNGEAFLQEIKSYLYDD